MIAYVGIGANLGDARAHVDDAVARLGLLPDSRLLRTSPYYRSAPIDASGDDYVNAVAALETRLTAPDLLAALHAIEADHGRERPYRNAPRTLDLDLLLYGDAVIATATLTVPHPRMLARAFVLRPLLDIAPAITVPGHGRAASHFSAVAKQVIERLD
jgi:2-amino-4-hydroxy-6-hydroxymethyldihydropteridine diphosphokinase